MKEREEAVVGDELVTAEPAPRTVQALSRFTSDMGNRGFMSMIGGRLARDNRPPRDDKPPPTYSGLVLGDEPGPVLERATPVIQGPVIPKLEAAKTALGQKTPDAEALGTADANIRQGFSAFKGIPRAHKKNPNPTQESARNDLVTQFGEVGNLIISLRAGTPKPVAQRHLTAALELLRAAAKTAADDEPKVKGQAPAAGDKQKSYEADAEAVQREVSAVLAVPNNGAPGEWEVILSQLEGLHNRLEGDGDSERASAAQRVAWAFSAVEAHLLPKKDLGTQIGARISALAGAAKTFAAEEERLEAVARGERPIPPEWDPETLHEPEPPPEPIWL